MPTTRNGKIARLPKYIRDELNRLLAEGFTGNVLADWLNSLPQVPEALRIHFDPRKISLKISPQNISEWRQGGYREWASSRECMERLEGFSEWLPDYSRRAVDSKQLRMVLTARYAQLLHAWEVEPPELVQKKLAVLKELRAGCLALRRHEQTDAKADRDRERLELQRARIRKDAPAQAAPTASPHIS